MWKLRPERVLNASQRTVCVAGCENEETRKDQVRRLGRGWRRENRIGKVLWEGSKNQQIKRHSLWLEYK